MANYVNLSANVEFDVHGELKKAMPKQTQAKSLSELIQELRDLQEKIKQMNQTEIQEDNN